VRQVFLLHRETIWLIACLGVSSDVLLCHDDIANLDDVDPRRVLYRMLHVGAARSGPDWPGPKGMSNHPSKLISRWQVFLLHRETVWLIGCSSDYLACRDDFAKINKSRFKASFCTIQGNDLANLVDVIDRISCLYWMLHDNDGVVRSGPKWPGVTQCGSGQSSKGSNRLSEINSIFSYTI
jgi:hypothetical protein